MLRGASERLGGGLRAFLAAEVLRRFGSGPDTSDVNVIVVGCGRVGSGLAMEMADRGDRVVVVDWSSDALARLPETFSGRTVTGSGFDREVLAQADVDKADALVAATSGDNTNIVTARVAREFFEVPKVIARIYDPRRAAVYERLGIPTVATVTWTMEQVLTRLGSDAAARSWTAATGDLAVVERLLGDHWAGQRLDLLCQPGRFNLIAIRRLGATTLAGPATVAQPGDIACLAVAVEHLEELDQALDGSVPTGGAH